MASAVNHDVPATNFFPIFPFFRSDLEPRSRLFFPNFSITLRTIFNQLLNRLHRVGVGEMKEMHLTFDFIRRMTNEEAFSFVDKDSMLILMGSRGTFIVINHLLTI
jgi:hypothetical protein